jgi:hypothetical protein
MSQTREFQKYCRASDALWSKAKESAKVARRARSAARRADRKAAGIVRMHERAAREEAARQKEKERRAKGVWIVGENFERLRHEFIASGGDVDSCPFEAPDNTDFLDHLYSITHS